MNEVMCNTYIQSFAFSEWVDVGRHIWPHKLTLDFCLWQIGQFRWLLFCDYLYIVNQPLWVAYVDLKAAFDSVDRTALWQLLLSVGLPHRIVEFF